MLRARAALGLPGYHFGLCSVVLWSLLWEEGAKPSLGLFISLFLMQISSFAVWDSMHTVTYCQPWSENWYCISLYFPPFGFSLGKASLSLFPSFPPRFSWRCSHLGQLVIVFLLFPGSKHQCCTQSTYPRENQCQQRTHIFSLAFRCFSFSCVPFSSQPVTSIVITWWLCWSCWCLCSPKPGSSSLLNQFCSWFISF